MSIPPTRIPLTPIRTLLPPRYVHITLVFLSLAFIHMDIITAREADTMADHTGRYTEDKRGMDKEGRDITGAEEGSGGMGAAIQIS